MSYVIDSYRFGAAPPVGTTVYLEEDFTATTTGDLSTNNLSTDVVGGGFLGSNTLFDYSGDGSGVECTNAGTHLGSGADAGQEDVQVTIEHTLTQGSDAARFPGVLLRGVDGTNDALLIRLHTTLGGFTMTLAGAGAAEHTYLTSGWATEPVADDLVRMVWICEGDDITLYSCQINGGTVQVINETHTLSATAKAAGYGVGGGSTFYGLYTHERATGTAERFKYFKAESIPV